MRLQQRERKEEKAAEFVRAAAAAAAEELFFVSFKSIPEGLQRLLCLLYFRCIFRGF